MSLPLNGFHQDGEMEPLSHSSEQTDRLEGHVEDWPDWSDRDGEGQPVEIHIQGSEAVGSVSTRLTQDNTEEEPWDDFEDTEPTSDLSPAAPSTDSVTLMSPTPPVKHAPQSLKLCSSKPLKLTTLHQSPQSKSPSSGHISWDQKKKDSATPHKQSVSKSTSAVPHISRSKDLGDEFTIKVNKKVKEDPELDFFADMVPNIKLSSLAVLPIEERDDTGPPGASPKTTQSVEMDQSVDTSTLTAKFAAVNMSEVCCSVVFHTFSEFIAGIFIE